MDGIYISALVIAVSFFIAKFLELRFLKKEDKSLKEVITNSVIVYFSALFGLFIINQFNLKTKPLVEPPAFVGAPTF